MMIRRHPEMSGLVTVIGILIHWLLCVPAAIQRGWPPLNPYLEFVAPYLGIFLPVCFPALDDSRRLRHVQQWLYAITIPIGIGFAAQYRLMGHARPNHGPYWYETVLIAGLLFPFTWILGGVLDRLGEKVWALLRTFVEQDGRHCSSCGYDLLGTQLAGKTECPECGHQNPLPTRATNDHIS
ncbi:MAG: hypothetical protein IT445_02545 [Phycisphaeraceae bacterium]|nr:hypothetical protein [Phycisphaeraceae bacterium]